MPGNPGNLMPPWKPGQSGNPSGKGKRKPISDRYEKLADLPMPDDIRRKLKMPEGSTFGDAVAFRIFLGAIKGAPAAARELREAIEGKAAQRIDVTSGGKVLNGKTAPSRPMKDFTTEQLAAIRLLAIKAVAQQEAAVDDAAK